MPETRGSDPRASVRTAVVWDALDAVVEEISRRTGVRTLEVVDVGGGTGGFAVPLAVAGHRVTVVDASPDALAGLRRRAGEAGVLDRVDAVQADAADLVAAVGARSADLVLCHDVLEHVDVPARVAAALAEVVRPHGVVSVLVAQPTAAVLHRVVAGRVAEALELLRAPAPALDDTDDLPRRLDAATATALLHAAGLDVRTRHGVRVLADLVPAAAVDGDVEATRALLALERLASGQDRFTDLAGAVHLLAHPRAAGSLGAGTAPD
ncbi:methyltransferase domain-containing protein [Quadrisphaera sp. GCM10027208]|uniref:methyltransferase domain-containing protein n=1 Tax=Quadrisphaera sp. GCM10027208 TaxID=3273423 RepID=UPI003609A1E4